MNARTNKKADGANGPGDRERHIFRVRYTSFPQIVVKEYVKIGKRMPRWVPKKAEKITWEGRCEQYTKIIVAKSEEEARSMLQKAAEDERRPGPRKRGPRIVEQAHRRTIHRVIVDIQSWEELL